MQGRRRVILTLLLIGLFVLLLHYSQQESKVSAHERPIDGFLVKIFIPLQHGLGSLGSFFSNAVNDYFVLVDLKKENTHLKEELALKQLHILTLKERLRIQLEQEVTGQKYERLGLKGIFARVIGYDPHASSQTVWLSAGSNQGLKIDQPVITANGLVGRVIRVFSRSSQVLLMVDPHFAIDVINEETRVRALVVGSGHKAHLKRYPLMTHLEFLHLGDAIRAGDLLITSGLNGIYPEGIPVGNVINIEYEKEASIATSAVLPLVDFSKLEQVFVITGRTPQGGEK